MASPQPPKRDNVKVLLILLVLVMGMVGLSFAAVPLYRIFCQVTGYGGTTGVAEVAPHEVLNRPITVRFNADINRGLPWEFRPLQTQVQMKIGENFLAHYEAKNISSQPLTGVATYNVTPQKAGKYFQKIECFCFSDQTLAPGQSVDMPVSFFIDPAMADDPNLQEVSTITLSYTFFQSKDPDLKPAQAKQAEMEQGWQE